jgi:hypothetical protein
VGLVVLTNNARHAKGEKIIFNTDHIVTVYTYMDETKIVTSEKSSRDVESDWSVRETLSQVVEEFMEARKFDTEISNIGAKIRGLELLKNGLSKIGGSNE